MKYASRSAAVSKPSSGTTIVPPSRRDHKQETRLGIVEADLGSDRQPTPIEADGDDSAIQEHAKRNLRVYRSLVSSTVEVFGDELKAARWLSTPNRDFNG